jgi:hypothetical protein
MDWRFGKNRPIAYSALQQMGILTDYCPELGVVLRKRP